MKGRTDLGEKRGALRKVLHWACRNVLHWACRSACQKALL